MLLSDTFCGKINQIFAAKTAQFSYDLLCLSAMVCTFWWDFTEREYPSLSRDSDRNSDKSIDEYDNLLNHYIHKIPFLETQRMPEYVIVLPKY